MDKKDIFYYAKYYRIPVYFQPEENEIVGRNKLCNWLLDHYAIPMSVWLGYGIKVYKKTITREELREMGLVE